jgi:hypothetical protein
MRKEAKDIQAVVDAEGDDAALRQKRAVVALLRAVAGDVAATVEDGPKRVASRKPVTSPSVRPRTASCAMVTVSVAGR